MKLTNNIWQHEVDCQCNDCNVTIQAHEPVIGAWQGACDHFAKLHGVDKVSLNVRSGARCYLYNRSEEVGSNDESQHPRCNAIDGDIYLPDGTRIQPISVYDYFEEKYPDSCGIGLYSWGVHLDMRALKKRW